MHAAAAELEPFDTLLYDCRPMCVINYNEPSIVVYAYESRVV